MEGLESEFDRLAKRQKSSMAKVSGVIDALLQQLTACKATHSNCKVMMEMLAAQSASQSSSNEMEIAADDDATSRANDERQPLLAAAAAAAADGADVATTNGSSSSASSSASSSSSSSSSGAASSSTVELPPELLQKSQSALTTLISFVTKEAPATKVAKDRKEYHSALAKFGKALDKSFRSDLKDAGSSAPFDQTLLESAITKHLLRNGNFDVADSLVRESQGVVEEGTDSAPFIAMFKVIESLRKRQVDLALSWADEHRDRLNELGSSFEFRLHKQRFVGLLEAGNHTDAIAYSRQHFTRFSSTHMSEIQRLMASLLWIRKLDQSPYSDLFQPQAWAMLQDQFTTECCTILGLPVSSPLLISCTAGAVALPTLLKFAALSKKDWSTDEVLPVEIALTPEYQFHSTFTCPVSKEQASKVNPPVRLVCGHVICRGSMEGLSKAPNAKFKCPYCPTEMTASATQTLTIQ